MKMQPQAFNTSLSDAEENPAGVSLTCAAIVQRQGSVAENTSPPLPHDE